jgi:hypothetical protein
MSYIPKNNLVKTGLVPDLDMSNYSQERLTEYIEELKTGSTGRTYPFTSNSGTNYSSVGHVYSPTQNRIYMVPNNASATWYYIDCNTGQVVSYAHGLTILGSYRGGVFSPTENRIYLIPHGISNEAAWHYIDCSDYNETNVIEYTHGYGLNGITAFGYLSGVYSPLENRIYLIPYGISNEATWHYIDCSGVTDSNLIVAYIHGFSATLTINGFFGGCYSPTENIIYLTPSGVSDEPNWYYIDCSGVTDDNLIKSYPHSLSTPPVNDAYGHAVYSPTNNRIYLIPMGQSVEFKWHYINCNNRTVVEYDNTRTDLTAYAGNAGIHAFEGGVYSPIDNRIYIATVFSALFPLFKYIECDTNAIVDYYSGNIDVRGGIFSPTENKIYFSAVTGVFGLSLLADHHSSRVLMANGMFNKL